MRITNETEYRAWNPRHNGVKRRQEGMRVGVLGAINLLGPRDATQRPADKFWNDQLTIVQLRYSFYTESSPGAYRSDATGVYGLRPLDVGRIFVSFWDFDTGEPQFGVSTFQKEAVQLGPQAQSIALGHGRQPDGTAYTEIETFGSWRHLLESANAANGSTFLSQLEATPSGWTWPGSASASYSGSVYMGTTYGVGEDSTRAHATPMRARATVPPLSCFLRGQS